MAVTHEVYRSFVRARALRGRWNRLAKASGGLFCSFEWCEIWWRHYGANRKLEVYAVWRGDQLIGVMPLFRERLALGGVGLRVVRLVGCDHGVTPVSLALCEGEVETVVERVLSAVDRSAPWDVIHFGPVLGTSEEVHRVTSSLACIRSVASARVGQHEHCHTFYDLPVSYDKYLASLKSHERRNLRRCARNLVSAHDVALLKPSRDGLMQDTLTRLIALHQAQWTAQGKGGQFVDWPYYESFHRELLRSLTSEGDPVLVDVQVAGQSVAVEYGYFFGSRLYSLVRGVSHAGEWREYSIGRMVHAEMAKVGISLGAVDMDDGRGAFEYKHRLGGRLTCERSVTAIRRGGATWVRFRLALAVAYLHHCLFYRLWFDWLRPRLRLETRPLSTTYIRTQFLSKLFKRTRFKRSHGVRMTETQCPHRPASCPHGDIYMTPESKPTIRQHLAAWLLRAKWELFSANGVVGLLALLMHRLQRCSTSRRIVYCCDLRTGFHGRRVSSVGLSVRRCSRYEELTQDDVDILVRYQGEWWCREFRRWFNRKEQLWIGQLDGRLAGFCWTVFGNNVDSYWRQLGSNDVLVHRCFTLPSGRRRGVYSQTLGHAIRVLAREGARRAYIDTQHWNVPSRRGILKAGFTEVARVGTSQGLAGKSAH